MSWRLLPWLLLLVVSRPSQLLTVKKFFRRLSLFLWCPLVWSLPLGVVWATSFSYILAIILKLSIMSPLRRLNNNVGSPIFYRRYEYFRCFRSGTCFVALLCTLSNSVMPVLYGAHTGTDVSLSGRTRILKNLRNILVKIAKCISDDSHYSIGFLYFVYMWSL